jgi:transcriptional regulator with XRE-family HTH domain
MDHRAQIQEFLVTRRARLTPAQAGLPDFGGRRRVAGLRREEVALLAGVSIDYYVRLERGNLSGASESVLENLSRALQLDEAERAHLFDLARNAAPAAGRVRHTQAPGKVPRGVRQVLDAIGDAPAWVRNARHDHLAANDLGRALYAPLYADPGRLPNSARFLFLDPTSRDFFVDWDRNADDVAAMLRAEAGHNPDDKQLVELIGELSTRSEVFRTRWAAHNVRFHRAGQKRLRHPAVGLLEMDFEAMELPAHPGLTMLVYTAPAGSPTADALRILASLVAEQRADARAGGDAAPVERSAG